MYYKQCGGHMNDIVFCAVIGVDCVENDSDAIARDEPKYLGYVFNVKSEESDDMIEFIRQKLKEFNVPYEDVYVYKRMSLPVVMVSDEKDIAKKIEQTADFFIKKIKSSKIQK